MIHQSGKAIRPLFAELVTFVQLLTSPFILMTMHVCSFKL